MNDLWIDRRAQSAVEAWSADANCGRPCTSIWEELIPRAERPAVDPPRPYTVIPEHQAEKCCAGSRKIRFSALIR
jgi:hypothetical protein